MILNNFFMSFLYNIEIDFLVKPWLCWTTKFFCKSFWIISSSCHFFRISCQTLIMLDMPRFWIARLNLKWNCGCNDQNFRLDHFSDLHEDTDGDDCSTKRTMFSHLSRFGSKSFAEEQLVLIEQHLYKLCDKACGSPMCICICHIQTPRNRCGKKKFPSMTIFTWRRCGRLRKSTSFWLLFSVTTWVIFDFVWFLSGFLSWF